MNSYTASRGEAILNQTYTFCILGGMPVVLNDLYNSAEITFQFDLPHKGGLCLIGKKKLNFTKMRSGGGGSICCTRRQRIIDTLGNPRIVVFIVWYSQLL